jgi:hypothetical protein
MCASNPFGQPLELIGGKAGEEDITGYLGGIEH